MNLIELVNRLNSLIPEYGNCLITAKSKKFNKARRVLDVSVDSGVVIIGIHTNSGIVNPVKQEDVVKLENTQAGVATG